MRPIRGIFSSFFLRRNRMTKRTMVVTRVTRLKFWKSRLKMSKGLSMAFSEEREKKAGMFSMARGKN